MQKVIVVQGLRMYEIKAVEGHRHCRVSCNRIQAVKKYKQYWDSGSVG
jgi:hypothetical protein